MTGCSQRYVQSMTTAASTCGSSASGVQSANTTAQSMLLHRNMCYGYCDLSLAAARSPWPTCGGGVWVWHGSLPHTFSVQLGRFGRFLRECADLCKDHFAAPATCRTVAPAVGTVDRGRRDGAHPAHWQEVIDFRRARRCASEAQA